ncbi:putative Mitogen-activated protein kinase 4 [Blattamonas nauphoetae]|uniref:Mitogen-activated protein kinase 4 n=1 Tax=Blattamonas nauphoetae TaxID=2049346 RepID=A0ABQ9XA38_9EUKA|nr:putative Mitogen-activated protein kinase 4 [Blattamonas nauphoetae]
MSQPPPVKPTHYSFTVPSNYQVMKLLGKGSYGIVCSALNETTNQRVAIKKIEDVFSHKTSIKRTLSEIRFLTRLKHPNIISISDIFAPKTFLSFVDLYWTSDLLDTDLHRIISSGQLLIEEHIKFFIYQITCGMRYIHSAGVIHRDLKPANILVNKDCSIKICDFGLAASINQPDDVPRNQTIYVQTRWYRAPELLLGNTKYDEKVDVWSLGCILLELLLRKPAFPGTSYMNQLEHYYKVLPIPSDEDLKVVEKPKARSFLRKLPKHTNSLSSFLSSHNVVVSSSILHLLERTLAFNPADRPTAEELLNHPFISDYKGSGNESLFDRPRPHERSQFPEDTSLSLNYESLATLTTYKHLLFQEILRFRPRTLSQFEYSIPEEEIKACELANPGVVQWVYTHTHAKVGRLPPPIVSPNSAHPSMFSPSHSISNTLNSVHTTHDEDSRLPDVNGSKPYSHHTSHQSASNSTLTTPHVSRRSKTLGLSASPRNLSSSHNSRLKHASSTKSKNPGHRTTLSMGQMTGYVHTQTTGTNPQFTRRKSSLGLKQVSPSNSSKHLVSVSSSQQLAPNPDSVL